jgi:uncharacterized membrane-anchored protein
MFKTRGSISYLRYVFATLLAVVATQANALDENSMIEKIQALDWQTDSGTYQLTGTNASVTTTPEEYLLKGKEAHKYMRISQGHDGFKPDALIVRVDGPNQDTQVLFTYHDIGFVKMDDWEEHIDKDELLKEIQKSTEAANKIKEEGYPKLYVDGWAQEPYLDKGNAVVYWAISAHTSEGGSIVNAKAMKLGRKGFAEIVWMGAPKQFSDAQISLSPSLAAYQYDEGSKYADFVPGTDTVAAVGAGALAYKLITGKAVAKASAGILALLAIFAKKLWILIFIPFIFAWKWIKSLFAGTKESA